LIVIDKETLLRTHNKINMDQLSSIKIVYQAPKKVSERHYFEEDSKSCLNKKVDANLLIKRKRQSM
jgi:ABC-type uncharacterized transport system substrate-binding protein